MHETTLALGRAPEPDVVDPEVEKALPTTLFYRDGKPLRMFSALSYHAPAFHAVRQYSNTLGAGSNLTLREREIIILRVAARVGSRYEWDMHSALCSTRGLLTDAEIRVIGEVDAELDGETFGVPKERTLLRIADEIMRCAALSADSWDRAAGDLGIPEVVEAISWAGWYRLLAGIAGSFDFRSDIPPE